MKRAEELADYLDETARRPLDNDAAAMLRQLGRVYDVAAEMVRTKDHARRNAAYQEMVDLIKGKPGV